MPDITMCRDSNCPSAKKCYRYSAKPNPYYQSFFVNSPRKNPDDEKCRYFMSMDFLEDTK